jgi:hypothetical protein
MSILDDSGVFLIINKFLNPYEITQFGASSSHLFILSNANAIWEPIYNELIKDKHIDFTHSFTYKLLSSASSASSTATSSPTTTTSSSLSYKLKYYITLWDSQRPFITFDELTTNNFSFRFKEAAGQEWKTKDPWWQGKQSMKVMFHSDGSLSLSNALSKISNDNNNNNDNNDNTINDDDDINNNDNEETTEGDDNFTLSTRLR